jgi:hypothetical protein
VVSLPASSYLSFQFSEKGEAVLFYITLVSRKFAVLIIITRLSIIKFLSYLNWLPLGNSMFQLGNQN